MNTDAESASPLNEEGTTEPGDHKSGPPSTVDATRSAGAVVPRAPGVDMAQRAAVRVLATRINEAIGNARLPEGKQMRVLVDHRSNQLVVLLTLGDIEYIVRRIAPEDALQMQHQLTGLKGLMLDGEG